MAHPAPPQRVTVQGGGGDGIRSNHLGLQGVRGCRRQSQVPGGGRATVMEEHEPLDWPMGLPQSP
jgi:hypothetical protein